MKAVLDTNVLVSGLIRAGGPPGRLVDWMRAGILQPVVDDRILEEYADVLRRPEMARYFFRPDTEAILDYLHCHAEHTVTTLQIDGLPDPDDAAFLEVAWAAGVPLVTGNKRHFPPGLRRGCPVMSPAEFLASHGGEAGG